MPIDKNFLPFNVFDLFAYLSTGFLMLITIGALGDTYMGGTAAMSPALGSSILRETFVRIVVVIVVSYIAGHLVAHISYLLCDRLLVQKYFGDPSARALALLSEKSVGGKGSHLVLTVLGVSDYARSFSHTALSALREAVRNHFDFEINSEHYSIRSCFAVVNEYATRASVRVEVFLGLYSFCRNSSTALLILSIAALAIGGSREVFLSLILLICSVFMFGRYLRFLKFYTDEILLAFTAYVLSSRGDSSGSSERLDQPE